MQTTTLRRFSLAAGIAGVAVFAWAIAAYGRTPAAAAMLVAVPALALAAGRRWIAIPALLLVFGLAFWTAFATTTGYFWLNRARLEALVAEIAAVPTITSLQLGTDDPVAEGTGRTGRFDSYRFINGQLVTQYREQVEPDAPQPTLRDIDVLRGLGVPLARYLALRASLERLLLSGFDRGQDGEIALNEVMPGGTPWVTSFVYRRDGGPPSGDNVQDQRRLAPHWFHVWRG